MKDQKTTTNENTFKGTAGTPKNVGTKQSEAKPTDKPVGTDTKNKMSLLDQ